MKQQGRLLLAGGGCCFEEAGTGVAYCLTLSVFAGKQWLKVGMSYHCFGVGVFERCQPLLVGSPMNKCLIKTV